MRGAQKACRPQIPAPTAFHSEEWAQGRWGRVPLPQLCVPPENGAKLHCTLLHEIPLAVARKRLFSPGRAVLFRASGFYNIGTFENEASLLHGGCTVGEGRCGRLSLRLMECSGMGWWPWRTCRDMDSWGSGAGAAWCFPARQRPH